MIKIGRYRNLFIPSVVDSDPTLALTKRTYRAEFAGAFRDALAALGARDRTLLRLCFVDGVGTERLAKL